MKLFTLLLSIFFIACISNSSFSQRGKDGVGNVSAANTQVNTYATVTATTANTVTVSSIASLTGGIWPTTPIAAGDLIMIIQMQGASMDIDVTPTATWGGNYTVPGAYLWSNNWNQFPQEWGKITAYNNAGKFEQVEVRSVAGNVITLQCNLQNTYTTSGRVQVVRIPRYSSLTLTGTASIVPLAWDGNVGGVVSVEVNGNIVLNAGTKISASTRGFRGGIADNAGTVGSVNISGDGAGNGSSYLGSNLSSQGARKGEGIGGFTTEYDLVFSRYGRGSPANGGGGGGIQNSGGGGGANVAANPATYTGKGVPSPTASTIAWNLEMVGFAGTTSPGGGRGGYSLSTVNVDATVTGPNNTAWSPTASDTRKVNGGLGGHPLVYDPTRLFMGGGGGAGDQDSQQGGSGGNGGGIVFVTCYGNISGSGSLESDGAIGGNTNPNNQAVSPFPGSANKKGNDGAGGGGAGGSIYVKNLNPIPATISLNARGGAGGNVVLTVGLGSTAEGSGPGGAGAGGSIALTSGTAGQNVSGGNSGTTNSAHLTEFMPNGATNGASGISGSATTIFNITPNNQTICAGTSATLTVTVTGSLPGQLIWYTTPFGTTTVATNTTTFVTPNLTSTTTYYVGVCPGTFRVPVTVTVNPSPTISGTAVLTNPTCSTPGSITGLTASGGTPALTYSWSGTTTPNANLLNVTAGTYTLTVTDVNGCFATSGPYTLTGIAGPIVNTTGVTITNQSCNGTMGSIAGITATGASLTFSWSNGGGPSLNPSNLAAGNYTLTVTDANGCSVNAGPFTVGFTAGPTINAAAAVITPSTCGNANGSITGITAAGTGLTYSWNGNSATGPTISGQLGGNYTLTVTNASGCTATSGPYTIPSFAGPVINAGAVTITNNTCNQNNGAITGITVSGGTNPLTNVWTNTTQTTLNLTGLSPNTYSLTVTDQNGCVAIAGPYVVNAISGPSVNANAAVINDQSCNGTMGSISGITVTGTGLNYSWSNGGGSSLNPSNLVAGSYSLTVTDANGCTASAGPFTVGYTAAPTINAAGVVTTPSTCGNANGSITGITAAGVGLTFTWNGNAAAGSTISGQLGGNYTLTVTNASGCTATSGPYTIPSIAGPTINAGAVSIGNNICNQNNGSISGITVIGGTNPLTNVWTNTSQTALNLTGLTTNSYSLTVTDQNGCVATAGPFVVNAIAGPSINTSGIVTNNQSCNGTMGSISGMTASGTGLTYAWTNGGGAVLNPTGLAAGSYSLTVTDANGCTANAGPFVIGFTSGPTVNSASAVIAPSTCGNANGSITGITTTGSGLTYAWNGNPAAGPTITSQLGGNYTLTVTDANGCSASSIPFTIPSLAGPTINAGAVTLVNENCNQANGSISGITISGGTNPIGIVWTNTPQTTLNLTGLSASDYALTITDANGCIATSGPYTVIDNGSPVISSAAAVIVNQSCNGTMGAISGITATGIGLTYSWSNGGGSALNASNLTANSYTLTVTDVNGCTSTAGPFTIAYVSGPSINAGSVLVNPTTCGNTNGSISGITATGTGLTYTWNGNAASAPNLSNQPSGTYSLVVTDVNGCTANSGPYNIAASSSPAVNANFVSITDAHCGLSDGALDGLTVSGGTPNYTYSWTGTAQTSLNLAALAAGSYTLTVTDQEGCTAQAGPFQVSNINGPSINETNAVATNVLCDGTLGSITGITSTGSILTYSWSNGGGSALDANGLAPGVYTLTVSDAFGCSVLSAPYTITAPVPLLLDASGMVVTPTSCVANTGSISGLVITGGVNPQVQWSNNQGTLNLTGLAVGTYSLSVTDDQGCSQALTVSIVQNNAPVIDATNMVITTAHCGQADGTVTGISVSGGTPNYTYSWNTTPAAATLNLAGVQGGNYTLTVTDSQGCSDNETITIGNEAAAIISDINLQVIQPTCLIAGSINGLQATGNGPFTYSWTSTAQNAINPSGLQSGTYDLTVTDAFGCTTQYGPVVLDEPVGPTADFSWTPSSPNIGQTVDFMDNSTGTNVNTWNWLIDTAVFVGQAPQYAFDAEGLFDVTLMITDANGCMDTLTQVISVYGQVIIPNVFTANGDGVNDTFEIQNLKPETNVLILNRWGDVVFETSNYLNDWGGKDVSGQDLVEGVYTYLIKTPENKQYHGFIHLIRSK
jgi:gliding motility-associated-like protein